MTLQQRRPSDDRFLLGLSERVFAPYSAFPAATMSAMLEEPFAVTMVARTQRADDGSAAKRPHQATTSGAESVGFFVLGLEPYGRAYGPLPWPVLARLNAIAVVPECQGKGIGGFLLEGAVRVARRHAAVSVSLMTAVSNRGARRLFDAHGFRYLFAVQSAYPRSQRAFVMTKAL